MTGAESDSSVSPALAALGPDWFSEVLGTAVEAVTIEPVAFTGATTDMARVRLSGGADVPATLVAKITGTDPMRAGMDAAMGLFAREGHFYQHVADQVPVRTPRCYHVGDGSATPLLLEDLGGLRVGDQMVGLTHAEAEAIVDVLAAMHAQYWESDALREDWLIDPAAGTYGAMVVQLVSSGADTLQEQYAGRASERALAAVADHAGDWGHVLNRGVEGPHTLVHNDVRLDNVFFDGAEPLLIDWQACARTRGTQDVANLLAQSMNPEDLTAHWKAVVERYHAGLVDHGVANYSLDQCVEHYRQNVPYALGAGMALIGMMDIGDGRGLGDAIIMRALGHIDEIDAFGAI